ncbi:MAG TPA: M20 family peptidase [Acidimicrobiales bacterium]|nr:M20 family peptidase [Acidimicrobiales bacterium]
MDALKQVESTVRSREGNLLDLSHRIHAHPELGFEEHDSSRWCAEVLSAEGFDVDTGVGGLDTAFIASRGEGPLHLVFCAEYDALPGIGHACGHNMIAAMSVGAGIGLGALADDLGVRVSVYGTPAEEIGDAGGKIRMLEAGLFEGVHAAMMLHPGPVDAGNVPWNAASMFDVHYHGKEAHAAAAPDLGVNAADALTVAQTAIGLLRQHLDPDALVHGIVTHGGEAPNIVPAHTTARFIVRAPDMARMDRAKERVLDCFRAGATATGATLEIQGGASPYAEVRNDPVLMKLYEEEAVAVGRDLAPSSGFGSGGRGAASTDMGNVSQVIPSIHPLIGIDSSPAVPHQPEFAAHAAGAVADRAVVEGAAALARAAVRMASDEAVRTRLLGREG